MTLAVAEVPPSPTSSVARSLGSMLLLGFVTAIYVWAVMMLCRQSLWAEVAITLGFPAVAAASGWLRHTHPRFVQLMAIESLFNLLALAGKGGLAAGANGFVALLPLGFLGFFVLQLGGFIAYRVRNSMMHGIVQSAGAAVLIGAWWFGLDQAATIMDPQGRFLMWGEEAPLAVKLYYAVWITHVMLVDSPVLPWLRIATVQIASVAVCLASGEFFHARLLTASHLFMIDFIIGYGLGPPEGLGTDFAVVPAAWLEWFHQRFRPALGWLCTATCALLLVLSFTIGLDLGLS